jgi:translation initiation factor eIF-2B subunit epsilon
MEAQSGPQPPDEYELWSGTSASSSRGGYRDLGIDICQAEVPAQATENFDWHDLRRHLLTGVLTSELLDYKINYHLVGNQEGTADGKDLKTKVQSGRYVERVRDTRSYGDVTNDILRRWVFPLVPDVRILGGVDYELRRGNVYVSREHVLLSRTTALIGPLLIGSRCEMSHNTTIHNSTFGSNCKVGQNTTVNGSHVFGDARIGNKCVLNECILGYGVTIDDNVSIGHGVLIGDGVRVGSGVVIEDFARIGREPYRPDDWDSDDESDGETERELKTS